MEANLDPVAIQRLASATKRARYVLSRVDKNPELSTVDAWDLRCELWNVVGESTRLLANIPAPKAVPCPRVDTDADHDADHRSGIKFTGH